MKMATRGRIAVVCAVVVCFAFSHVEVWAANGHGMLPAPDPGPFVMQGVVGLQGPDLVIQEMSITHTVAGEFPTVGVTVRVQNRGTAPAGPSEVLLLYIRDILDPAAIQTYHQSTGPIVPGAFVDLDFTYEGPLNGLLLAFADAPVTGKPSGQVIEGGFLMASITGGYDLDNAFGVTFDVGTRPLPLRFENPGLK